MKWFSILRDAVTGRTEVESTSTLPPRCQPDHEKWYWSQLHISMCAPCLVCRRTIKRGEQPVCGETR